MSAIAAKVNSNETLADAPLRATSARPLTTATAPVLCVGLVALAVGAAAIGLAAEEAGDN